MNPQISLALDASGVIERVSRRARRIRLNVRPDGRVVLTIPLRASRTEAYRFLEQNQVWIARQHAQRRLRPVVAPLRWDGSDRLPLRGPEVAIERVVAPRRSPWVQLEPQRICLHAAAATPAPRLRTALLRALRAEAAREAETLLAEEGARLGLPPAPVRIRDPRTRWGSCAPDGRIMLSLRLLLAPPEVFRYVVVHELCHRRWRGHGPRFWALVARQMPEFEAPRAWLRQHGETLQGLLPA